MRGYVPFHLEKPGAPLVLVKTVLSAVLLLETRSPGPGPGPVHLLKDNADHLWCLSVDRIVLC